MGDRTPIEYRSRDERYVEKLATPDVTIADIIGDIDPIKAAKGGHAIGSEMSVHYGLLPRANRGIFAINELPDLAGKIQVGLFNIMQEGDVQIKGYPGAPAARRRARVLGESGRLHRARQDRDAAEGSHRLGNQNALSGDSRSRRRDHRTGSLDRPRIPAERFSSRNSSNRLSKRSRSRRALTSASINDPASASACRFRVWKMSISNAERRAIVSGETDVVPRIADIYSAMPAITGKIELEYEGELKGAETIARDLIRQAVQMIFRQYYPDDGFQAGDRVV